jgi:hypothetical protein
VLADEPEELPFVVNDRDVPDLVLVHHGRDIDGGHVRRSLLGIEERNIADIRLDAGYLERCSEPEVSQGKPGLGIQVPRVRGDEPSRFPGVEEIGIPDHAPDAVSIRLAVPDHVHLLHNLSLRAYPTIL